MSNMYLLRLLTEPELFKTAFSYENFFSFNVSYLMTDLIEKNWEAISTNEFYFFDHSKTKPILNFDLTFLLDFSDSRYNIVEADISKVKNDPYYIFVKKMHESDIFIYLKNCELSKFLREYSDFFSYSMIYGLLFGYLWTIINTLFSVIYVISLFIKKNKTKYNNTTKYLSEAEKEISSIDDVLSVLINFLTLFSFFFVVTTIFCIKPFTFQGLIHIGLPSFLFFVVMMPTSLSYDSGLHLSFFLRGACNTTIFLLEFMYDILCSMIMFIRLLIQNIRLVLMFFAFFEICEFIWNFGYFDYSYTLDLFKNNMNLNSFSNFHSFIFLIEILLKSIVFFFYNIVHLLYETLIHFFAYIILVFWFFFFYILHFY